MKKAFLIICFISAAAFGQADTKASAKLAALPYYTFGKGLGITAPDSIFQINMRVRMQNRLSYYDNETQDPYFEAQVRRLRLRFDGFLYNPHFQYVIQLSFGAGDVGPQRAGENLNVIRDAIFYYRPDKNWQIGFGVTKLPGTRQTINGSGALQLTDRSINNAKFGIDRDIGLHLAWLNERQDKPFFNLKGAITLGEGRNWTTNASTTNLKDNNGLAYTAKAELFPLGSFKKDGQYFEGDLLYEPKLRFMVSGAFSYNDKARKTLGQTGDLLFEARDMHSTLLDFIAKYRGFPAMVAYMDRDSNAPVTTNFADGSTRAVFNGYGMDYQLSYCFPKSKYEIATRYSYQVPSRTIRTFTPEIGQFSVGVSKYIREHALKFQAEYTTEQVDNFNAPDRTNWYGRLQVEIGI